MFSKSQSQIEAKNHLNYQMRIRTGGSLKMIDNVGSLGLLRLLQFSLLGCLDTLFKFLTYCLKIFR